MRSETKPNVLLVDDRPENLLALEGVLESLDVNVVRAASGPDALARLQEADFAVIALDVMMPEMDGFETAMRVREHERSAATPIIFLTASDRNGGHEARAHALGAVDFLYKPFDPAALRAKIGALVTAFQRGQQAARSAMETLERREAELTDFMENAAVGLHWVDGDGTILWANQAEMEMLGYLRDEYIGHHIAEFHADEPTISDILQRLTNRETLHNYEARLRCKDGSTRHVLISSNVMWDGDRFVHTRCLTRDITERVQAQETQQFLAEAGDLLAASLDYRVTLERLARLAVPRLADWCAVDVLDAQGVSQRLAVVHVDPAKVELAYEIERRFPPDPASPYGLLNVLRTGEPEFFPTIPDALLVESSRDAEHLRITRELGLLSAMVVPLVARDRVLGAISLMTAESGRIYTAADLTLAQDLARRAAVAIDNAYLYQEAQQELAERRRVEEAARFQADLLGMVEQAVIATDLEGRITYWNRFAETLYGWNSDEVLGRSILEVTPSDEAVQQGAAIIEQLTAGTSWAGEFRVRRRDGTVFPAWVVDAPIRNQRGELVGVVGVSTDISTLKRLEASLQERMKQLQEADRQKDEFLAMLAHELRNPLGAVSNATAVLNQLGSQEEQPRRLRSIITRQVDHLRRMVEDLLEASRFAQGLVELKIELVHLERVVSETVEICREPLLARGHHLSVSLPPEPLSLEADPTRLVQVVCNLLDNAAKYTEPGGRISLSVVGEKRNGEPWVLLRVRDNGQGLSPELLPKVFELFTQADRSLARTSGGLGLGLAVVKRIVEMHGGTIQAFSPGRGQGSTFEVRLPSRSSVSKLPAGSPRADVGPALFSPQRVLIVEDGLDAAETLADLVRLWGHEVQVAHTGTQGLELAQSAPPDVVLLDIGLPGMDGYEVARRLRAQVGVKRVRLVALTGYGQQQDQHAALEAGFDHHLTKPVDPETLKGLLAGAL